MSQAYSCLFFSYKNIFRKILYIIVVLLLASCVEGGAFHEFSLDNIFSKKVDDHKILEKDNKEFSKDLYKKDKVKSSSLQKQKISKNIEADRRYIEYKPIKIEKLLDAQGNWNLVEQGGVIDPTKANLMARKKVNIKRRKNIKELSAHFKPDAKSGEDGRMRVLRLEPDSQFRKTCSLNELEIVESHLTKPRYNVVEGEENKSRDSFSVVIPKRKPNISNISKFGKQQDYYVGDIIIPPPLPIRKTVLAVENKRIVEERNSISKLLLRPVKNRSSHNRPSLPLSKSIKDISKVYILGNKHDISPRQNSRVVKIRSGEHVGKTRLVIEVSQVTKYKIAIDYVRNVLRIRLDNISWDINPKGNFSGSKLLGGYIARKQQDGSILFEVRLEKRTKIIEAIILPPNASSKYRVVIDLKD